MSINFISSLFIFFQTSKMTTSIRDNGLPVIALALSVSLCVADQKSITVSHNDLFPSDEETIEGPYQVPQGKNKPNPHRRGTKNNVGKSGMRPRGHSLDCGESTPPQKVNRLTTGTFFSPSALGSSPSSRTKVNWTIYETIQLLKGVKALGVGSWKKIHSCFFYPHGLERDGVSLKDRYRVLIRNNETDLQYWLTQLESDGVLDAENEEEEQTEDYRSSHNGSDLDENMTCAS